MTSVWGLTVEINFKFDPSKLTRRLPIVAGLFRLSTKQLTLIEVLGKGKNPFCHRP
jgi:hypothetical protein